MSKKRKWRLFHWNPLLIMDEQVIFINKEDRVKLKDDRSVYIVTEVCNDKIKVQNIDCLVHRESSYISPDRVEMIMEMW